MISPLNWLPGKLNTRTSTGPSAMVHLRVGSGRVPVEVVLTTYRRVLTTITAKRCTGPTGAVLCDVDEGRQLRR